MARAKYRAEEVDGATKIEEAIREALSRDTRATVTFDAIEKVFDMVDDPGNTVEGDLGAKIEFLCRRFGCTSRRNEAKREVVFLRT